jgi:hypothetical protein
MNRTQLRQMAFGELLLDPFVPLEATVLQQTCFGGGFLVAMDGASQILWVHYCPSCWQYGKVRHAEGVYRDREPGNHGTPTRT